MPAFYAPKLPVQGSAKKMVSPSNHRPITVYIFIKVFTLSVLFPDFPESFQTVQTVSRLSGKFPDCLESFKTVWTVSRLSGHFPDCPDTFMIVQTVFRLSRKFPDCPDSFMTVRTVSRLFRQFPAFSHSKHKNFPDAQKLSG